MYNFLFLDILCEIYLTDFLRGRENDAIFKFKLVKPKRKKKWKSLSCVQLFGTPWTIQYMEFSRPEYRSG